MRERLLADLRLVHDRSESARLLIAAHRSAKTYGEQMRGLIACEVVLLKVKRTLDLAPSERHEKESRCLADMLGYLRALSDEYRAEYKKVADCQRYDEALTTARSRPPRTPRCPPSRGARPARGRLPSASDTGVGHAARSAPVPGPG